MEERADSRVAFLHMRALAALSVVALAGVVLWQVGHAFTSGNFVSATNSASSALSERAATPYGSINWQTWPSGASAQEGTLPAEDPDGIGNIAENISSALLGSYTALADTGSYTPEEGERMAADIAESLRASISYKLYSVDDLTTDTDTSYERMLAYRSDLRIALEPLLENPGYELNIFANYFETKDTIYLDQLKDAVQNYQGAVKGGAQVIVPSDAVSYHVEVLNSLSEFGSVTLRLSQHADDAFATAALLRTYNESEARLLNAFNELARFYRNKQP